jgi:hypothetical protein
MRVANILIDLGLPPIEDIPQLPKIVRDALTTVTLILERLQRVLDSSAGQWDCAPFPPLFFSSPVEATVGENMVIYAYIHTYIYTHTHTHLCLQWMGQRSSAVTSLRPRGPHHHKSRPWGSSWICTSSPMGGIP